MHSHTSRASEYVFADNIAWHCEEEIEAAIVKANNFTWIFSKINAAVPFKLGMRV